MLSAAPSSFVTVLEKLPPATAATVISVVIAARYLGPLVGKFLHYCLIRRALDICGAGGADGDEVARVILAIQGISPPEDDATGEKEPDGAPGGVKRAGLVRRAVHRLTIRRPPHPDG